MEERKLESLTSDSLMTNGSNHTSASGRETGEMQVTDTLRRRNGKVSAEKLLSSYNGILNSSPHKRSQSETIPSETVTSLQLDGLHYNARVRRSTVLHSQPS